MKNTLCKFIVIIINWNLVGSRFALASYCSFSVFPRDQISLLYFCSQLNEKLSPFYQYFYTLRLITSHHQLFSPFQEPELVWNFACIKKRGAGCIWDWPYPLTIVSNVIRDAIWVIFQGKSIRSKQILIHIMQATLSYTPLNSLKS